MITTTNLPFTILAGKTRIATDNYEYDSKGVSQYFFQMNANWVCWHKLFKEMGFERVAERVYQHSKDPNLEVRLSGGRFIKGKPEDPLSIFVTHQNAQLQLLVEEEWSVAYGIQKLLLAIRDVYSGSGS
jgi:hypothetical protein